MVKRAERAFSGNIFSAEGSEGGCRVWCRVCWSVCSGISSGGRQVYAKILDDAVGQSAAVADFRGASGLIWGFFLNMTCGFLFAGPAWLVLDCGQYEVALSSSAFVVC